MLTPRSCRPYLVTFAAAAALIGARSANATAVTTTSYSVWQTTLTASPTEANLTAITPSTSYNTSSGLTLQAGSLGFTFTGPDGSNYQMTGVRYNGLTSLEGSSDAGAGLNVAMPGTGVNAFLLGIGSTGGTPMTLTLSDGETFSVSSGLFGISISHPISSLLLTTSAGSQAVIEDFWYGNSNLTQDSSGNSGTGGPEPVAEVATSLMFAGGFLFLFGAWRRFGTPAAA